MLKEMKSFSIDYATAYKYYKKAHKLKHAHGTYLLGVMCYEGLHVERDLDRAIILIKEAAKGGDKDAKQALSLIGISN